MRNFPRANEDILVAASPHILSKLGSMIFWLTLSFIPLASVKLIDTSSLPGISLITGTGWANLALAGAAILVITTLYSVFKITWKPVIAGIVLAAVPFAGYWVGLDPLYSALATLPLGALAVALLELSRRRKKYYVTSERLLFVNRGLTRSTIREVNYSRITDIVLEKKGLGRLLGYGNIHVITQSGMGTGDDYSLAGAGASAGLGPLTLGVGAGGGKSATTPRAGDEFVFLMVPKAEEVSALISERVRASESAPILERIARRLEERED